MKFGRHLNSLTCRANNMHFILTTLDGVCNERAAAIRRREEGGGCSGGVRCPDLALCPYAQHLARTMAPRVKGCGQAGSGWCGRPLSLAAPPPTVCGCHCLFAIPRGCGRDWRSVGRGVGGAPQLDPPRKRGRDFGSALQLFTEDGKRGLRPRRAAPWNAAACSGIGEWHRRQPTCGDVGPSFGGRTHAVAGIGYSPENALIIWETCSAGIPLAVDGTTGHCRRHAAVQVPRSWNGRRPHQQGGEGSGVTPAPIAE